MEKEIQIDMRYCLESPAGFKLALICGMCRVGKTLIGNIVSTCPNVEYAEEPWAVTNIVRIGNTSLINRDFAKGMLAACVKNLFDETYLMRCVNFRPIDLSYIGNKKTPDEIKYRMNNVMSYRDVNPGNIFVINLSEVLKELDFIREALPKCKIIYVVRHASSVVSEIVSKGWFTDSWIAELDRSQLLRKFKKCYLPIFIKNGDERYFFDLNQYERALYYYNVMMEWTFSSNVISMQCLVVRYEDFIQNPNVQYGIVKEYLELQDGKYTADRLSMLYFQETEKIPIKDHIRSDLIEITNRYLKFFNYEAIE